jgi:hypothetical protein
MAADFDVDICDECGNRAVVRRTHAGRVVEECEFCGALRGGDDTIEAIEQFREAQARGIDPAIFPLVHELDGIHGLRCFESTNGEPEIGLPPAISFRLGAERTLRRLECLLTSLELSNRQTVGEWHIEVALKGGALAFTLRPKVLPAPGRPVEPFIDACRGDVDMLARNLRAHKRLSWWQH